MGWQRSPHESHDLIVDHLWPSTLAGVCRCSAGRASRGRGRRDVPDDPLRVAEPGKPRTREVRGAVGVKEVMGTELRSNPADSHPEVRSVKRCDSLGRSSHLDLRRGLASEQVKEKFTRRAAEPSSGFSVPNCVPLAGSRPFNLEPDPAQPATQVATTSADVSP